MDKMSLYVNFLVDRLHVGTPMVEIVREFRNRFKKGQHGLSAAHRKERKRVYRLAMNRHHFNRELYRKVMGGRL